MRTLLGIMAACLLGLAAPASAQLVQLSISGTLRGTQSTIMCGPGSPSTCRDTYPTDTLEESYERDFLQALFPAPLVQGDNPFSYGSPVGAGLFTGIINNSNGVLTGRDLFFSLRSGSIGAVGSSTVFARADTFAVTAVPEPATWALMLVGFLVVGSALRQAPRRRALLPA